MTSTVYEVLTAAFQDDPVVSWLFPDPAERRRLQPSYYAGLLGMPGAEAHLAGADAGAAVWLTLPAGRTPFDEPPGSPDAGRLHVLGRMLTAWHPHDEAHLYLACVGVVPGRQGEGIGSALLRQGLAKADADGRPVYLEASSSRSRDLYLRHGFDDLGEPIQLPDGPRLWPMWRDPTP